MQALVSLNHRLLNLNYHSLRGSVTQKTGEFVQLTHFVAICGQVCKRIKKIVLNLPTFSDLRA